MVQGEGAQGDPVLCSTARVRHYLHLGCSGYVAYVMETREKGKANVDDVQYPYFFPEDFTGVLPKRQVEFQIDLVPGVALIAKAPYRLAPLKMHEVSTQL